MHRSLIFVTLSLFAPAGAATTPEDLGAARALFDSRRPAEAQRAFELLAAADSKNPEINFYLGQLALRRNDADRALAYLHQAVVAAPTASRYHNALGDAYGRAAQKASVFSQLGLAKKCLAAYRRAVELEPANLDFHQSLFEYYRNAPGIAGGGRDKAVAEATAMKQLDPSRGRLAFASLHASEKKYPEALAEFDEVLKTNPDEYIALYQVGRLAATTGQFIDRGLSSLRRCLELPGPTATNTPGHAAVQWRLGQLLAKKSDPAGARAAYEAAVKLEPGFTPAVDALKKLK